MSKLKFGRNYFLQVQTLNNELLQITLPFTIEFDITKNTLSSANVCQIRVYNLSQVNRNQILYNIQDQTTYRTVVLQAGYGSNNLPVIFGGNITQAWSVREGNNFITTIECFDAGFAFANGFTSTSFPNGTSQQGMLENLAGSLPNVTVGAIGSYPGTTPRGNAIVGNTCDVLRDMSGGGFFIDNGQAHVINDNEYIDDGSVILVNSSSGLLNTPVREQNYLSFDMIFEPQIKPGRLIQLQSSTVPIFNGFRKVTGVKHRGMISAAVCGDVTTTVEAYYYTEYIPVVI